MVDVPLLASRWPLPGAYDVRDRLLAAWADAARGYHDLRHLVEVLDHLEELLGAVGEDDANRVNADAVRLAAWFHDAVYHGAPDDEERSAALAEQELTGAGVPADVVAEVARLVLLTATHDPEPSDLSGALLSDADLAVLAAEPQRYEEYVDGVRREHSHLPDAVFAQGRADVLRGLLAGSTLFRTTAGRRLWEERARANVEAELAALDG